ncbi:lipase 1 [Helicoverpa armigera]|uniref:lipase 1 n=1 Tax=Helicoverpa armigera TaxID=29058 RepID=UPI003083171D
MHRIFLGLFFIAQVLSQTRNLEWPEDAILTFGGLAMKYVQRVEEFDVLTPDGYYLKLFHIPGDRRRPVLLIHGALDSSDSFIMRGNTSLAVALARDNYDVWAMNYKGNRYARTHVTLDADADKEFWNFSLHEIGTIDIPTTIDFVLKRTGQRKLSVIGFSEGTTASYVMGATRPEYNDKIKLHISLAPVCFLQNTKPLMSYIIQLAPILNIALEAITGNEIGGYNSTSKALINQFCMKEDRYKVCLDALFSVTGANAKEIEMEFFPVVLGHFPAGSSRKNLYHLAQIGESKKFQNYDYGLAQNMRKYKRPTPPEYDLSRVTMNIALIVANNDKISTIKDTELLRQRLPNVVDYVMMQNSAFNHIDYVWGRSTHKMMFPHIFRLLNKYNY